MKMRRCPNCGSNINANSLECEYCGTTFSSESKTKETKGIKIPRISKVKLRDLLVDKRVNTTYFPAIIFSLVWLTAATIMFIAVKTSMTEFETSTGMDTGADIMMLFPLLFVFIGIAIVFATVKSAINKVDKNLNNMYKRGDIEGAYEYMQEKISHGETQKMGLYLHDLIIIEFYVKKNLDKVREYVAEIELYPKEISPEVNKIATKLGMSLIGIVQKANINTVSKSK